MSEWTFSDDSSESVHRISPLGVYESTTLSNIEGVTPSPFFKSNNHVIGELRSRLSGIDAESVRPLRAKLAGNSTAEDDVKLKFLDDEATAIRVELSKLVPPTVDIPIKG